MMKMRPAALGLWLAFMGVCISASPSQAAERAGELFVELCSVCHGAAGKGDGPTAAGLNPRPADFTNCQVMEAHPEETLFTIIKRGGQSVGRSAMMPAWGEALNDGQIRALVAVVRGFCKK